jgi:lipopolysaccharide exporter
MWSLAHGTTGRLLGALRVFLLARLLTPRDFGLAAIGFLVVGLYTASSASGIGLALLQRRERASEFFDTAWTLGLIRGVVGTVVQLAIAPAFGLFFREPDAVGIVRGLAPLHLLRACSNVGLVELKRDIRLGGLYALSSAATVAEIVVAVPLALRLGNAWALVGGLLAAEMVQTVLSYVVHPYRPHLRLDRAQARELLSYARWVLSTTILSRVRGQGIPALVGLAFGVEAVGLFTMAERAAHLAASQVTRTVASVSVSAYVKLQDDLARLRAAYGRTLRVVAFAAVPISAAGAVYGPDLVLAVFGPRWTAMVPLLQVLSFAGLARALAGTATAVFMGTGRPWLSTRSAAVEILLVGVLIGPLGLWWATMGVVVAATVGACAGALVALAALARVLQGSARDTLRSLACPAAACLPFVALRLGLTGPLGTPVSVALGLALSAALYLGVLLLLDRTGFYPLGSVIDPRPWRHGLTLLWAEVTGRWRHPR